MTNILFFITLFFSAAFVAAVILGKASKDEPLDNCGPLEKHETFWHK